MKWLLPDPNDPVRKAPRLTPGRHRLRDQAQGDVEGLGQRGRHDVLVDGAGHRRVLDAVRQPQHVILGARPLGNVEDVAQQFAHLSLIPLLADRRPRRAGSGRQAASSGSVLPT